MVDYSKLTDDELDALIEKEYGEEWRLQDIDTESDLFKEYWKRITSGG